MHPLEGVALDDPVLCPYEVLRGAAAHPEIIPNAPVRLHLRLVVLVLGDCEMHFPGEPARRLLEPMARDHLVYRPPIFVGLAPAEYVSSEMDEPTHDGGSLWHFASYPFLQLHSKSTELGLPCPDRPLDLTICLRNSQRRFYHRGLSLPLYAGRLLELQ